MSAIPTGKKIYLCTPSLKPVTQLNGIDTESIGYSEHLRDYSSLTFDVYEYITVRGERVRSNGYDELDVYMYLYLEDIAFFQMQHPTVHNDGIKEYKSVTAYSIDKEWEDKDWVDFKVNTGEKDSLEQLVEDNLDDLGFTINFIDFFNPDREDLSLLHIILEKMPTWSVDPNDIDHELWNKRLSFSEDSINLYALMTSVIAPRAECIFIFDCLNKKIKAIAKDNLDFDTNIFIGFRNLASQIEQTVNEDSVFTRFNVAGGNDLTINDWNYNNGRMFNLNYFMHEPYMTNEQAAKFRAWINWQDEHREEFANLSQTVSDLEAKIYDLKYRVPDDGCEIDQWKGMNEEGLEESLAYYQSLLNAFEVSVDTNPTYTGSDGNTYHVNIRDDGTREIVDENDVIIQPGITLTYNPWTVTEGGETHVDYDAYYALLANMENGKAGYYTYYEIITYIIPNIEIALWNLRNAATEDDELDYNEDFETHWELYGSEELRGRLEDYQNRVDVLEEYSKYPVYFHQLKRMTNYESYVLDSFELTGLEIVVGGTTYDLDDILALEGVTGAGFQTEVVVNENDRLYIVIASANETLFENDITSLTVDFQYKQTENGEILTGSITESGTITPVAVGSFDGDEQWERLYNEYMEKVAYIGDEETEDTILWWIKDLEEQIETIGQEEMGYNLSRMEMVAKVSMYDTEILESDSVDYSYDVIELDEPNPEWDFTQDDIDLFTILMHDTDYTNENILITSLNTTSTVTSTETIIQKEKELWEDAKEKLSEASQPQITFSVSMDNLMQIKEFEGLREDCSLLRFIRLGVRDDYSVKLRIVGRSWNPCEVTDDFNLEFSNMITSESGRSDLTDLLNNTGGNTGKNSITLGSGNSDSDKEYAANLLALMVSTGLFSSAVAGSGVGTGGTDESRVNQLIEDYLLTNVINEASFNKLFSRYIDVEVLVADAIKTDTIVANIIAGTDQNPQYYMNLLTGALNMSTLTANQAFISSVQSISSTAVTSVVTDQYVYNAVAGKITVADLAAGDITISNSARILSENGMMVMNGTALQIYGEDSNGDPYVGVQLGYDTNSNPSLIVRNEDGATILTPSGITTDAIADGLIVNDMVHDGTLSKSKMGFPIVDTDANGNISITNIKDGSGGNFGVEYTNFKNSTESTLEEIESKKMYRVIVESDNGNIFKNGDVNCTLSCRVFSWDDEITNDINAANFTWTRKSKNTASDTSWNTNHSGGTKTITITPSDVYGRSVFTCTVTLPDGTTQSSE